MTTLLFDFDGTLADSLPVLVEITNRLAPEFGYRPTPLDQVDALKGLSARQLIWQSQMPLLRLPALLRRVRAELHHESPHLQPFPGIPETLRSLRSQGHQCAIVTTNAADNVQRFLDAHGLTPLFLGVEGGGTLFGKGRLIRRCLQHHALDPAQTLYVGDETRDIEAARRAGLRMVAVTWGFNSASALTAAQPDWLISQPQELLAIADAV